MDALYNQLIAGKQKAVVGFIITALATFLAQHGLSHLLDMTLKEAAEALVYGLFGYLGVYTKANK